MIQIQSIKPKEVLLNSKTVKHQPTTFLGNERPAASGVLSTNQIPLATFKAYNLSFKGTDIPNIQVIDDPNTDNTQNTSIPVNRMNEEELKEFDNFLTTELEKYGIKESKKKEAPTFSDVFEKYNKLALVALATAFNDKIKPENFEISFNEPVNLNTNSGAATIEDFADSIEHKEVPVTSISSKLENVIDKNNIKIDPEKIAELCKKLTIKNPKEATLADIYEKIDLFQTELAQLFAEASGEKRKFDANEAFKMFNQLFLTSAAIEHNKKFDTKDVEATLGIKLNDEQLKGFAEFYEKYGIKDPKTVGLAELYEKTKALELKTDADLLCSASAHKEIEGFDKDYSSLKSELETKLKINNVEESQIVNVFKTIDKLNLDPRNSVSTEQLEQFAATIKSLAETAKKDPDKDSLPAILDKLDEDLKTNNAIPPMVKMQLAISIMMIGTGMVPQFTKTLNINPEEVSANELIEKIKKAEEAKGPATETLSGASLKMLDLFESNYKYVANKLGKDQAAITIKDIFEDIREVSLKNIDELAIKKDPKDITENDIFNMKNKLAIRKIAGQVETIENPSAATFSDIVRELNKLSEKLNTKPESYPMMDYIG